MTYRLKDLGIVVQGVRALAVAACANACSSAVELRSKVADVGARVQTAEAVGAAEVPRAALHLKLASHGLAEAKRLIDAGEDEEAKVILDRAMVDAEVARALREEVAVSEQVHRALGRAAEEALIQCQKELTQEREADVRSAQAANYEHLTDVASVDTGADATTIQLDSSVLFASGQASLLPYASATLDRIARAIAQISPGARLRVIGHTDDQGSADANRQLSLARAQAVAQYLIEKGIDKARVVATGMGAERPAAANQTPAGRANNRRVELIVESANAKTNPTVGPDRVIVPEDAVAPGDKTPIPLGEETMAPGPTTLDTEPHTPRAPNDVRPSRGTVH